MVNILFDVGGLVIFLVDGVVAEGSEIIIVKSGPTVSMDLVLSTTVKAKGPPDKHGTIDALAEK